MGKLLLVSSQEKKYKSIVFLSEVPEKEERLKFLKRNFVIEKEANVDDFFLEVSKADKLFFQPVSSERWSPFPSNSDLVALYATSLSPEVAHEVFNEIVNKAEVAERRYYNY